MLRLPALLLALTRNRDQDRKLIVESVEEIDLKLLGIAPGAIVPRIKDKVVREHPGVPSGRALRRHRNRNQSVRHISRLASPFP